MMMSSTLQVKGNKNVTMILLSAADFNHNNKHLVNSSFKVATCKYLMNVLNVK